MRRFAVLDPTTDKQIHLSTFENQITKLKLHQRRQLATIIRFLGQTLVSGNVWGKSCTGGISLKNLLDMSCFEGIFILFKLAANS